MRLKAGTQHIMERFGTYNDAASANIEGAAAMSRGSGMAWRPHADAAFSLDERDTHMG